jgi:hypothetical protein
LKTRTDPVQKHFWEVCFGIRPREELYDLKQDPDCVINLADSGDRQVVKAKLKRQLFDELKVQEDPRVLGQGMVFDEYLHANKNNRGFYEKYMTGEKVEAGWVNESDFEKMPLMPRP